MYGNAQVKVARSYVTVRLTREFFTLKVQPMDLFSIHTADAVRWILLTGSRGIYNGFRALEEGM